MKLQFKHQQFQTDACNAVCDVFAGQTRQDSFSYVYDTGNNNQLDMKMDAFANPPLLLRNDDILQNIRNIQIHNGLKPDEELVGLDSGEGVNLSVEMETGTGKTYTYVKTMYELNRRYGWSKFIVVVPSVAIREGVYKSFKTTEDHFFADYGKKIRFFIYNSSHLNDVEQFATNANINVMIINMQAFAKRGNDAVRISMKLDTFAGRRPIDIIAATHPIIILDEPQSMSGPVVTSELKKFNPLFTLRYSATHRNPYNMIYRLDALDAYNQKLVKKISVRGVSVLGDTATNGYVYLSKINLSVKKDPTASLEIDYKTSTGPRKRIFIVTHGDNLYDKSGGLDEYADGWVVTDIDGERDYVRFENGRELTTGEVIGSISEDQLRRIQIRETIKTHLQREEELFERGIKVLSLFFIDEVAKYRTQDNTVGLYAQMFQDEYELAKSERLSELGLNPAYEEFLKNTDATSAHSGYFACDKKGKFVDSTIKRSETSASKDEDVRAYDLIMKDKERLLSRVEPVRFIFSHSALREGWDNPNVFQICTLKQSNNDVSRRQEIGRGMRLCVNQTGERMDTAVLGDFGVHKINMLTVVASESYEDFVSGLQDEFKRDLANRPRFVNADLFCGKIVKDENDVLFEITRSDANRLNNHLVRHDYIDDNGNLTTNYHEALKNGTLVMPDGFKTEDIVNIISTIYQPIEIDNAAKTRVTLKLNRANFDKKEFQELWSLINRRSAYTVEFNTDELIKNAVNSLNTKLHVSPLVIQITGGNIAEIDADGLKTTNVKTVRSNIQTAEIGLKYDLIGKIAAGTDLTRKCVADILTQIRPDVFDQFKTNPEDFIIKVTNLINDEKATAIIEHVTYNAMDDTFSSDIFTAPEMKAGLKENSVETPNHNIYNYVITDSNIEKEMARELEQQEDVCVYAKLPNGFYISTPVGKYNPDWAIAFKKGSVKHIYFIAETKGSMRDMELRPVERAKIDCAHKHFLAISGEEVKYDVVENYQELMNIVKK